MPADDHVNDDLRAMAATVIDRLRQSGIHAFLETEDEDEPGVKVQIDAMDNADRGVYLEWSPGAQIKSQVVAAMIAKRYTDPVVHRSAQEKKTKIAEAASALLSAGVRTEDAQNDYAPYSLKVVSVLSVAGS
ncbi:hypothetical protein [Glycomyces tenuis]|uniref:hypothetical protein n=1 Tax=Glycomyces tenuis TaxID=58116 RepID=UPI000401C113|nr:hypothetical protein [Glycomyces tenuis]